MTTPRRDPGRSVTPDDVDAELVARLARQGDEPVPLFDLPPIPDDPEENR